MLPKAPSTAERLGVMRTATMLVEMGLIWRETANSDVGIDGHVELIDENGFATGKAVAIQIKSGSSYFRSTTDNRSWRFKPEQKHITYWEYYPLPVLLVLHLPSEDVSYWIDARHQIRSSKTGNITELIIPKCNILQSATASLLLEGAGAQAGEEFHDDLWGVFRHMLLANTRNGSFSLTYFDLFARGITNIGRSVYFGVDLADDAAEFNFSMNGSEYGYGMGGEENWQR